MIVDDKETLEWFRTLKNDLLRINKIIGRERESIEYAIENLRKLEGERERLLDNNLGEE